MPRGTRLTEEEQEAIRLLMEEGYKNRQIALRMSRSEAVVRNFKKSGENYGLKAATKGNSKLTHRQKGEIRQEAIDNKLTCRQIKDKLELPITTRNIAKVLNSEKNIKWTKIKSKPRLTAKHKEDRLTFARKYMSCTTEWDNVFFSDEKKINLDGPDCYSCYWHDISKIGVVRSKRNFGGGSVMAWGAFCAH